MKAENLRAVQELMKELNTAEGQHNMYKNLTTPAGGSFGLSPRCFIDIGGDVYGNGRVIRNAEFKILDLPDVVKYCHRLEAEAWSKVISIRFELRNLGVELTSCEGE